MVFFALFTFVWARRDIRPVWLHLTLVVQCLVVLGLLFLEPEADSATVFFALLSYQAAVVFTGRVRWLWVGVLVALIAGSLMVASGAAGRPGIGPHQHGLRPGLPGLAVASQEIEAARARSRRMVDELEQTHEQLERHAAEVEELSVLEERNRLARELHDSVSQAMFGVLLATRSAQIMLDKDPQAVPAQIEGLQGLTQDALARMRGFISELRPKS